MHGRRDQTRHGITRIRRPGPWLAALIAASPLQAIASPQQTFRAAFAAIRSQDSSLESVQLRILASGETTTGCGRAPTSQILGLHCSKDHTIYTNQHTLELLQHQFGRGSVRYLAAHELAHGRQHAITGFSRTLIWSAVVDELQADCIAGAYLRRTFGISSGSSETAGILAFAEKIGDYSVFEQDWHGTPNWRRKAVSRGLNQGDPARCLSSSRFNYGAMVEQGRRWLPSMQRLLQP